MEVIRSERTVFFDVDGTLVTSLNEKQAYVLTQMVSIIDPYENRTVRRLIHYPHVKLLKNYVARGFCVFVWSKNGHRWAENVLIALGLNQLNIRVLTKPCIIVDDEPPENWIGERVFMSSSSSFGRD